MRRVHARHGRRLRVLIADGHPVARMGLRSVIEGSRDLLVAGEADTGREALNLARKVSPGVVVLDLDLRGPDAIETAREIRRTIPGSVVLALSADPTSRAAREAMEAGVRCLLSKSESTRTILDAVRALGGGGPCCPGREPRRSPLNSTPPERLSGRERQVLQRLALGRSTKEIARELGISPKTVESHRGNLKRKTGLYSLALLVRYAIRHALITP